MLRAATIVKERLENPDRSLKLLGDVLRVDPLHEAAAEKMRLIYSEFEDWEKVADVYLQQEQHVDDDEGKARLRSQAAEVYLGRLKDEGRLIPLRQLLSEPLASYLEEPHTRLIELGMLFTYLVHVREDTRTVAEGEQVVQAPFRDYVRGALRGQNVTTQPVHALLNADLDQLQQDFFAYQGW